MPPVHRISQVRILECIAISFSRGSSWPRGWTQVSRIGKWVLYHTPTREAHKVNCISTKKKKEFPSYLVAAPGEGPQSGQETQAPGSAWWRPSAGQSFLKDRDLSQDHSPWKREWMEPRFSGSKSRAPEPGRSELLSAFWQLEKAEAPCDPLCSILAPLANASPVYCVPPMCQVSPSKPHSSPVTSSEISGGNAQHT